MDMWDLVNGSNPDVVKKVFVFRHGSCTNFPERVYTCWSPDRELTEKGKAQMRAAATKFDSLLDNVVLFACSVLPRAGQSLCQMMLALGRSAKELDDIGYALQLWSMEPEIWCTESQDPVDLTVAAVYKRSPEAVKSDGKSVLDFCRQMAGAIEPGQSALCVSHGGPVDAALAMAEYEIHKDGQLAQNFRLDDIFARAKDLETAEGVIFGFSESNELLQVVRTSQLVEQPA